MAVFYSTIISMSQTNTPVSQAYNATGMPVCVTNTKNGIVQHLVLKFWIYFANHRRRSCNRTISCSGRLSNVL